MSFEIFWSDPAKKHLRKLEKTLARRIVLKVKELKDFPMQYTKSLTNCTFRALRVGDWRIIVDVVPNLKKVKILLIGKRDTIYKVLRNV